MNFLYVNLSVSAINSLLLEALVSGLGWKPITSQFLITLTLVPLSFAILKYWVFRERKQEPEVAGQTRKKIDVFLTYYVDHTSGLTNMARDIAEYLATKEWDIHVHCVGNETRTIVIGGVTVHAYRRSFRLGRGSFSIRKYWEVFRLGRSKGGLCHVHMPYPESFWLALWLRKSWTIIATYHCDIPTLPGRVNFVAKVLDVSHSFLLRRCTTMSTTSEDYALHSRLSRFFSDGRNVVIPVVAHDRSIKEKKTLPRQTIAVGFLGRPTSEKGIDVLVRAMKILPSEYTLVMAGPKVPYLEQKWDVEVGLRELSNLGRLETLGRIEEDEIPNFFSSIDVLVLPSTNSFEAMGIVQIEAISAGVPVVASNLPGVRTVIEKTGFGQLFPVGDAYALAENIETVIEAEKNLDKALQVLRNEFLHPVSVVGYENLFAEVMEKQVQKKNAKVSGSIGQSFRRKAKTP